MRAGSVAAGRRLLFSGGFRCADMTDAKGLDDEARPISDFSPKGFAEAFEIYELRSAEGDGDAWDIERCREWEVVYAALRNGPLAATKVELANFLAKYPHDGVARYYQINRGGDETGMSS